MADPMAKAEPYLYDYDLCEKEFVGRIADKRRRHFAIIHNGKVVGQIYLKRIKWDEKSSEFDIYSITSRRGYEAGAACVYTSFGCCFIQIFSSISTPYMEPPSKLQTTEKGKLPEIAE